jgi:hypothetical protein
MSAANVPSAAARISAYATGIYMAYPTSPELKPIYRGLKTHVNERHTKVGQTRDGFATREREYCRTFGGQVRFVPLVSVQPDKLDDLEGIVLQELMGRFNRVGRAREWFDTAEREVVAEIVLAAAGRLG